jgi:hypothetical protein
MKKTNKSKTETLTFQKQWPIPLELHGTIDMASQNPTQQQVARNKKRIPKNY